MDPITGILVGASLLGGVISATGGKKQISPEWLREHFGPQMVTGDTMEYFNRILNSPAGQQAISQAVQQGNQVQNDTETRAAAAGMGPAGGANSGSSVFGEAAAGGAAQHAVQNTRADLWTQSFNAAQQMVNQRMNTWAGLYANQGPTAQQLLGGALGNAAGVGLTAQQMKTPSQTPPAKSAATPAPTSMNMLAPPTQATSPTLGTPDTQSLAAAQMPRAQMRRIPNRIDRFSGRSMSVIQPQLQPAQPSA